jgi:GDP-mannose transporter
LEKYRLLELLPSAAVEPLARPALIGDLSGNALDGSGRMPSDDTGGEHDDVDEERAVLLPLSIEGNSRSTVRTNSGGSSGKVGVTPTAGATSALFRNAMLSCMAYSFCSVSMVVLNKCISSTVDPAVKAQIPNFSVVFFQCLIAVVLVETARFFKVVEYPDFNLETARAWLPLNILFISMLFSGFMALSYVSVPMVT